MPEPCSSYLEQAPSTAFVRPLAGLGCYGPLAIARVEPDSTLRIHMEFRALKLISPAFHRRH